jgi:tetratricopeptide (TPR) repeat protein
VEEWLDRHPLSADARYAHALATATHALRQMSVGQESEFLAKYEQINRELYELTRWDGTNARWRNDFAATLAINAIALMKKSQYDEAMTALNTSIDTVADLAQKDKSDVSVKITLYFAYRVRGELALERKQWPQAIEGLTEAEKLIAAAAGTDADNVEWQQYWAQTYLGLAAAHAGESWAPKASQMLRRGRAILETLIKTAPEMVTLVSDLVAAYETEILALQRTGAVAEAAAIIQERDHAIAGTKDTWVLNEAHLSDIRIGDAAKSAKRSDEASGAYLRGAEKMARATDLEPGNAVWWHSLGKAHEKIADVKQESGDADGSEAELQAAVNAGHRAAEAGNSAEYADDAAMTAHKLGKFYERSKAAEKALVAYELAGKNADLATKLDPDNELYFWRASVIHRQVGEASGTTESARAEYVLAVKAAQRAVELAPKDGENYRALYLAQWFLATNSSSVPLLRDALQNAERAAQLSPQDENIKKDFADLRELVAAQNRASGARRRAKSKQ